MAINYRKGLHEADVTEKLVRKACQSIREHGCSDLVVKADVSREEDVVNVFDEVIGKWGS